MYSTPMAIVPSNSTRVTRLFFWMIRLFGSAAAVARMNSRTLRRCPRAAQSTML